MLLKSPTDRDESCRRTRGEVIDSSSDDSDLVANTADVARNLAMNRTPVASRVTPLPAPPRSPGRPLESTAAMEQIERPVLLASPPKAIIPRSAPPARPPRQRTTNVLKVVRPSRMPSESVISMNVVLDDEGRDLERNLPQYVELLKSHGVTDGLVKREVEVPRVENELEGRQPPRVAEGRQREYDRDRKAVYGRLPRRPPVQYAGPSIGRVVAPLEPRSGTKSGSGALRAYNASPLYYQQVRQEREGGARGVRKEDRSEMNQLPAPPTVEVEPASSPVAEYEYVPYVKTNEISGFNSAELEKAPSRSWTVQPPRGARGPWTVQAGSERDGRGGISWDRAGEELEDLPRDTSCRSSHRLGGDDSGQGEDSDSDGERYSDAHPKEFEERSYSGRYSRGSDEGSPGYGHTSDEESDTDGYSDRSDDYRHKRNSSLRRGSSSRSSGNEDWSSSDESESHSDYEEGSAGGSGRRHYSGGNELTEIRYENSPRPAWENAPRPDPFFIKEPKGRRPVGADEIRTGQANGVLPSYNRSNGRWSMTVLSPPRSESDTVKPSEIMGVFKSKSSQPVEAKSAPCTVLEEPPPATPANRSGDAMPNGEATMAWMTGVLRWIAKLDGMWYMRGNAGSSVRHYLKPIDVSTADKGRFMELQSDGVSRTAGYLILKEPEQRHLNNHFYADLIELEDLRPSTEKGVTWQLTDGCFISNFETLTFVRASMETEGCDRQWLVFDRTPRVKGGTPESQKSRKSSEPVDTPEPKSKPVHRDEDWKTWNKQEWDWSNGGQSRRWKNGAAQQWECTEWDGCEKGWGGKTKPIVDWSTIEYHPDWRRFTGEWYGFKQYGDGKRPSFKSRELPGPHKDDNCIDNGTILFIWGIPYGFREDDLQEAFSEYGEIQETKVKRKEHHGDTFGVGYGWIRYKERSECEWCISKANHKLILKGMKHPVEVRPFMERYFFRRYTQMAKEDIPKRCGYWLKVLNNIDYHSHDFGKRFVLRVFYKTIVEFNTRKKEAILSDGGTSMRVAAFAINLFLENVADCKVDNYHSPGEVDDNYRVYKNFSCRGATNSEKFISGMTLDLSPCNNTDLSSADALVERMMEYISKKRYSINNQESGWLA